MANHFQFRFTWVCVLLALSVLLTGCYPGPDSLEDDDSDRTRQEDDKKLTDKAAQEATALRKFEFRYNATFKNLPKDKSVKVWFPVPQQNNVQVISAFAEVEGKPDLKVEYFKDEAHGNKIGYFESKGNEELTLKLKCYVERQQAKIDDTSKELAPTLREQYTSADKLIPTTGKPAELLAEKLIPESSMEAGKLLYDVVEEHMKYDKSKPGYGKGDAIWACDSKTGNCTDFHSLFISLARNQNIAAKFEIGFPVPPPAKDGTPAKIGGYHCWAWFHVEGQGWVPVDISEADKHPEMKDFYFGNLTADRVGFTTGRDIVLEPKSKSGPLNYFIYPHVEVDGEVLPKEQIELNFSYVNK